MPFVSLAEQQAAHLAPSLERNGAEREEYWFGIRILLRV